MTPLKKLNEAYRLRDAVGWERGGVKHTCIFIMACVRQRIIEVSEMWVSGIKLFPALQQFHRQRKALHRKRRSQTGHGFPPGSGLVYTGGLQLLPCCDRRRIGTQIDHGNDTRVFRVDARDQSFVGARNPEASRVKNNPGWRIGDAETTRG